MSGAFFFPPVDYFQLLCSHLKSIFFHHCYPLWVHFLGGFVLYPPLRLRPVDIAKIWQVWACEAIWKSFVRWRTGANTLQITVCCKHRNAGGGGKKMETIKDKHTQLQSKNSADTWMMQQKKNRIKAEKQQRKQEILQTQQKSESKHYKKKPHPRCCIHLIHINSKTTAWKNYASSFS